MNQYPCDYSNLAPTGCTQYIFGESEGEIQSYNFKGNEHLANQNQKICIRREANNCRICYTIENENDFMLTGELEDDGVGISGVESACCGQMDNNEGYDCLIIPFATHFDTDESTNKRLSFSEFCGSKVTFLEFDNIHTQSVCSRRVPFEVSFMTDGVEVAEDEDKEAARSQAGFRLAFRQDSTLC